ncbi:MAG: mechanosensitive ion channel family protein [Gemmatimonadetes bacterium]|nr:mechanosensitive ion channel family protein [Gemmatimonadota bacterium]
MPAVQGLSQALARLQQLSVTEQRLVQSVAIILILLLLRWIARGVINRRVEDLKRRYFWRRTITYILGVTGVFLVGRVWFAVFGSLATFFGLIGAGIAVALKDPLTNLAGFVFILWRRPFRIGDRIQIGATAGDVIDVRLFQFTLLEIGNWVDADQSTGRLVHVPNGKVFLEPTANYTMGFPFIWNEIPVPITFESDWKAARAILQDIADRIVGSFTESAEREILEASRKYLIFFSTLRPAVYVNVKPSGVLLTIRYTCEARKRRGTSQAVWEEILDAFAARNDIDFAYPTTRFYDHAAEGKSGARAGDAR